MPLTREEFCDLINETSLSDDQLARLCDVSRPTISRWKRGVSAPHPLVRDIVVSRLYEVNALSSVEDIDISDVPEVTDFSNAVRGRFYSETDSE